jgi:hypothetical protein
MASLLTLTIWVHPSIVSLECAKSLKNAEHVTYILMVKIIFLYQLTPDVSMLRRYTGKPWNTETEF